MLINHLARVPLAHLPTPLEEMPRLRDALGGGPRLFIKRDDQTGLATGGNKTRKLEFVVAEALGQGADTLITAGGPQSNHCRQTAAAVAKLGLRCILVLSGPPIPRSAWQGNLLLDDLLGAEIRWSSNRPSEEVIVEVAAACEAEGARPYVIPDGTSVPLGAAGYIAAVEELVEQLKAWDTEIDRIILPSGSAGTQAGILIGVKALGLNTRVEGVCDNADTTGSLERLKALTVETLKYLKLDLAVANEDFVLHGSYGQPGYAVITAAEREAIRLLARTEGIVTDPVYTGRALAGLIDLIRRARYAPTETILFWHTGGVTGLFAHATEMLLH
jgi:L-cysteate sulfo-lyase